VVAVTPIRWLATSTESRFTLDIKTYQEGSVMNIMDLFVRRDVWSMEMPGP
jgi:hypothetical protein